MERKRVLQSEIVTLVTIPKFLPVIMWPSIGEYDHPYIIKTTPCEVVNGKYRDLRTGTVVNKTEEMLEWKNLSGTVFRYTKKHYYPEEYLLLSRSLDGKRLILFSLSPKEITPMMMVRPVLDRQKEQ